MGFLDRFFKSNINSQNVQPSKKKILIAEADPSISSSYVEIFRNEFDVMSVANGAEGLNALLSFQADIIIIDLDLPVMNGKAMLHSLRQLGPYSKTIVIVISQTADAETIRLTKVYDNANEFILKDNAAPQQIYDCVKKLLV